ncbi:hypothetical protein [Dyella jiangningensis]
MARTKQKASEQREKTPAQERRNELAAAIRARGERGSNIWLLRPPFQSRDLVLNSDLQFEAFYVVEGEPTFRQIRYLPGWYQAHEHESPSDASKDFAVVTTLDEQEFSVRLAFDANPGETANALTPLHGEIRVHIGVLDSHIQRVENWRRVIPCIRRVRLHATSAIERQIALMVHARRRLSLRDLRERFLDVDAAIFFGSVAILLRRRELQSDLDTRPWSLNTCVWTEAP